jgi:hypothetical protein
VRRDGDGGVTILPVQGEVVGEIEEVSFHAYGSGQALVLLPLLLSPTVAIGCRHPRQDVSGDRTRRCSPGYGCDA